MYAGKRNRNLICKNKKINTNKLNLVKKLNNDGFYPILLQVELFISL